MAIFAELFLGSYLLHLQSKVATLELNCCRIGVLQLVYIGTFVYTVCSECSNAQCFYREGHAYMVKNPMVCLSGPTTKF